MEWPRENSNSNIWCARRDSNPPPRFKRPVLRHQSFGRSNAPGESRTRIVPVTAYSLRRRGRYGSNKAGHAGFEPAASWLTTKRALRAAPMARGSACEIRTHDLQLEKLPA